MLPITRQTLINWAGPSVFRDGQTLCEKGYVVESAFEPPYIRGSVLWGNRPLKTGLRIMPDGTAENLCPCRDSTERGIICAHAIALGLDLVRRATDPLRDAKRLEEMRRAARLNRVDESQYLRRVEPAAPGAVAASLRIALGAHWVEGIRRDQIPLVAEVFANGTRALLDQVPASTPLAFSKKEEAVLFVLEDITGGPAAGRLTVSRTDFLNVLQLLDGAAIHAELTGDAMPVTATPLPSHIRMDLDRENGELILFVHTELPFLKPGEFPVYIVAGRSGWVYGASHFWRLENVLPEPLMPLYDEPIAVKRPAVPHFLQAELPTLAKYARIETDISSDLFAVEPASPRIRLVVKGSPASLSAVLQAEYGETVLVAGRKSASANFSIPDPKDIFRYMVRNPDAERYALGVLARFGFTGEAGDALSQIVGLREVLNFLGSHMPALRRMGWKVQLEGRIAPYVDQIAFVTPVVDVRDEPDRGSFEIGFRYESAPGAEVSAAEVQRALRKGDSFIEQGDRVLLLDGDAIQSLMNVFRDCDSREGSRPGSFRLSDVYAPFVKSSLDALDGVDVEATPTWLDKARSFSRASTVVEVPLRPELDGVLRHYQKEGLNWLRFLESSGFCGILADEMGLGKTVQTLAWLDLERCHPTARGRPALIVCPTSLVENWMDEIRRFVPHRKAIALTGPDRHKRWDELPTADVVITSYALMRRDVEQYLRHEFAALVLDEAQHIKNRSTQNAITAKSLKAFSRVVLTGTPIENGVSDLWSIMDFLMPGYLGSHPSFHSNYELPIAQGDFDGEAAQAKLRRKLHPFLLRRMKNEVAKDLPEKIQRVMSCSLTPDQAEVYQNYLESSRRRLTDLVARVGFDRSRMEVLKTLLRLRQICCHLDLLKLPELTAGKAPSAKMDLFFELLDEALDGGHRVLVFSQFVSMLTILRRELDRRQIGYCYLDGSTPERQQIVREFNTNRSIPLFLISLKAGGTGLNLTGADTVIHFDPWWNPAVEDQATDRAHRIGQKRVVYSMKLITRGTVEEKVLAMQRQKQSIIDATVVSDRDVAKSLTWEDIRDILA